MPDLLIELLSEEIPARMQAKAADDLRRLMTDGLVEAGLTYAGAAAFATPRRLTLTVQGLTAESPTTREERKGPRADAPEKALAGFLRSTGLSRDQLELRDDKKGQVFFATIERAGRPADAIVAEVLEHTIRNFPWPKSMRWGAGDLRWVRPLHSILCLLTDEAGARVVPLDIGGIAAGDTTAGHRFMSPVRFTVTGFDDYAAALSRAHVILEADDRAAHIWADATNQAFALGLEVVEDAGLLHEVAGLVEWPVVLMGEIGGDFLELPPEVLQTSMREHQKFFSVREPGTGRITRFVTVANRETADDGAAILAGNRKVLDARLSDAKFFWENDLRTIREKGMEGMGAPLADVIFHARLGSQADRIARIASLAREIAPAVGAKPDLAAEAARICKADLASEMVYEFPELQGVMGSYYAEFAGHDDGVPEACAEHYAPLGPSDAVPTAPVSVAVALADKLDILTGFWAIDEKPTGSKDPFALRRAALGVIRLVLENDVRTRLYEMSVWTFRTNLDAGETAESASEDLLRFLHDRLKVYLRDKGIPHDVIEACLAIDGADDLTLLVNRANALADVLKTEDGENLVQGFKRANNILSQAEAADGVEYSFGADPKLAETDEERSLFKALDQAGGAISSAIEAEDLAAAMRGMAALRAPVDAFFEAVQVNADNSILRRNRLNLLHQIRATCGRVADLTRLEG
ncbi:MAG: glycine--tRNA ligase subunit beta [Rhodobacteraceae bacterium]|nr:glycine--tRNA ligase subunit beta [Paracoccaceae bacterium]